MKLRSKMGEDGKDGGTRGRARVVGAAAVVSLRGGLEHGQWPDS